MITKNRFTDVVAVLKMEGAPAAKVRTRGSGTIKRIRSPFKQSMLSLVSHYQDTKEDIPVSVKFAENYSCQKVQSSAFFNNLNESAIGELNAVVFLLKHIKNKNNVGHRYIVSKDTTNGSECGFLVNQTSVFMRF